MTKRKFVRHQRSNVLRVNPEKTEKLQGLDTQPVVYMWQIKPAKLLEKIRQTFGQNPPN